MVRCPGEGHNPTADQLARTQRDVAPREAECCMRTLASGEDSAGPRHTMGAGGGGGEGDRFKRGRRSLMPRKYEATEAFGLVLQMLIPSRWALRQAHGASPGGQDLEELRRRLQSFKADAAVNILNRSQV